MVKAQCNSLFSSMSYQWDGVVVDPGDTQNWSGVKSVLLTHAHFDHIYGLNELMRMNPEAKVYTNVAGREMLADARKNMSAYHESPYVFEYPEAVEVVEDGSEIALGNGIVARALFTPGHNPSCITWIVGDMLLTGDSYIPGVKVVTMLPGGNRRQADDSLARIMKLAEGRQVLPGHRMENI